MSVQVAATAPLSSTTPVHGFAAPAPSIPATASPAATTSKKFKKPAELASPDGGKMFEGGASSWGADEHGAALPDAAQHEFSNLADKLLHEMETRVTHTVAGTAASLAQAAPPAPSDDTKRRKMKTDDSSEEEPVTLLSPQAAAAMVAVQSPAKAAAAPKPKPVEGDLSAALKKPPAKKKAK